MRVTLLGSAAFACPTLDALLTEGHEVVVGTQPSRPAGRGRGLRPTELRLHAEGLGLDAHELEDINDPEGLAWLTAAHPDLLVVVAFGQKLGPAVRAVAPWGCINIHPSLLPRWRGAAPVQAAVMAGDERTGVCIIDVVERMDAGDILSMSTTAVGRKTTGELLEELSVEGARLLVKTIDQMASGELTRVAQDESKVTRAKKLVRDDGRVRWEQDHREVDQRIRAVTPTPGAFALLEDGSRLRILAGEPVPCARGPLPGEIIQTGPEGIHVACGRGAYLISRLQRAGGNPLDADAFLRGFTLAEGSRLGP
jgi:methionyl-tRNA formyltransferase